MHISPDQRQLAVASGSEVALVDLDEKAIKDRFPAKHGTALTTFFSPDGKQLTIADQEGHIAFWDPTTHRKR